MNQHATATNFSRIDHELMARALTLANQGRNSVTPNPAVGCVLAQGAQIVGEGFHQRAGHAHAEVNALRAADDQARGATAYVTLEPCSSHGRTPPCVDALIDAGVARVVFAMQDPNPDVRGNGAQKLRDAGVAVEHGLLLSAAEQVNPGYALRMRRGRPRVTVKMAASVDGATAMRSGQSQWITGAEARDDVQRLRAASCAIMTGIGTVLADDPSLNVRNNSLGTEGRQPLRVVVDSHFRIPDSARLLSLAGHTLVAIGRPTERTLSDPRHEVLCAPAAEPNGRVALADVLTALAQRGVNELLVEAGRTLCGSLWNAGLVDRLVLYMAPKLLGSETQGLIATPNWLTLEAGRSLVFDDVRSIGDDIRIIAHPAHD